MTFSFHRIPVGICNCFILCGERTVLIDGGAEGNVKAFTRGMAQLGVDPKEISLILLTHGHWDHIGSLHPTRQLTGGAEGNVKAFTRGMAMNAWYLRLTPGLPVLADDIRMVVGSWKKILPLGIKQVYPAHGMDFPVEVMHREIKDFESRA